MSADLIAFLRARLDEDEQTSLGVFAHQPMLFVGGRLLAGRLNDEVHAKRAILDRLEAINREVGDGASADPHDLGEGAGLWLAAEHLALPYQDHPDYREEWRP